MKHSNISGGFVIKVIPRVFVDLSLSEVASTLSRILNVKKATGNDKLCEFEETYARYIGTKAAVSFPSCRSGMYFSLKALGLSAGDEVILPAFTFWVDAAMVIMAGLKPVFVDVNFSTANIDTSKIEQAITPRTRVIFPTHLNGMPADLDPIIELAKKYKLRVIEDCARSCGAKYKGRKIGSFDIGAFSFGYGKSFYSFGGGMVTSNDGSFVSKLRELKKDFERISTKDLYIQTMKGIVLRYLNTPILYRFSLYPMVYKFQVEGNERYAGSFRVKMPSYEQVPKNFITDMYNVQAMLGLSQLERIDITNKKRMENAKILNDELSGLKGVSIPPYLTDREFAAIHYAIWTENTKPLQVFLTRNNVDAQDESAVNTTELERFKNHVTGRFPNAEKLHKKTIFLPTHPYLTKKDMIYMAGKVKEFIRNGQ